MGLSIPFELSLSNFFILIKVNLKKVLKIQPRDFRNGYQKPKLIFFRIMTKRLHTNQLFWTEAGNKNPVWIITIEYLNFHKSQLKKDA